MPRASAAPRRARRTVVVGDGHAGAMAALRLCELGVPVRLVTSSPGFHAPSGHDKDGLSAAIGVADSTAAHLADTLAAGGDQADRSAILSLVLAAPRLHERLTRLGVPFERGSEGRVAVHPASGCRTARTAYAGPITGQQVARVLAEQLRRCEAREAVDAHGITLRGEALLERNVGWDWIGLLRDDGGMAVGVIARHRSSGETTCFAAEGVCAATGGFAGAFSPSTSARCANGAAAAMLFEHGALFVDPSLVELGALSLTTVHKAIDLGDRLRGEGGRWFTLSRGKGSRPARDVPDKERRYLANDPAITPGAAARTLLARVDRENELLYFDASTVDRFRLRAALSEQAAIYKKLAGVDPYSEPLPVVVAVVATLGGLWIDSETDSRNGVARASPRNHATTVPGLYAAGDVACQYHGAGRLPGNGLLARLHGGELAASGLAAHRDALRRSALDLPGALFERAAVSAASQQPASASPAVEVELARMLGEAALYDDGANWDALAERVRELCSTPPTPAFARLAELFVLGAQSREHAGRRRFFALVGDSITEVDSASYECAGRIIEVSAAIDKGPQTAVEVVS